VTDRPGSLTFQLSYGDCDAVGIAYFAIYYRWMERAYSTWLYTHGIRSGDTQAQFGVVTVGVSSGVTYVQPARVFDTLVCQPVLDRIGSSSYRVGFEFTRDGTLISRGQITFVCRTPEWGRASVPDAMAAALRSLPPPSFDTAPPT